MPVAVGALVAWQLAGVNLMLPLAGCVAAFRGAVVAIYAAGIAVSLPLTFVPMVALFDGERPGRAFALSARAFALNVPALAGYACVAFVLLLIGIATSGIGARARAAVDRRRVVRGVEGHLRREMSEVSGRDSHPVLGEAIAGRNVVLSQGERESDPRFADPRFTTTAIRTASSAGSATGAASSSTSVTRASGGPRRHHSANAATAAGAPCANASTVPSARLRTQPVTPASLAACTAACR